MAWLRGGRLEKELQPIGPLILYADPLPVSTFTSWKNSPAEDTPLVMPLHSTGTVGAS